jgi:hypothetical protein
MKLQVFPMNRCAILSLGLLLTCASFARAATIPPPEKLLPSDTLVVLTIPDYSKAQSVWAQWPSSQLWADSALKPFKDKFLSKWKTEMVEPLEKELGIKFSDYAGLAQGQVTAALTPGGPDISAAEKPGFLLLIDSRDKSDNLKTNLETLKKKWVDSGKQIRSEKIRETDFTALVFKTDDLSKTLDKLFPGQNEGNESAGPPKDKPAGRKVELLIGQSGSLLIMATIGKDIEKILVNQSGGSVPTLSEQANFNSSYGAQFREAQAYGWLNLKPILDAFIKSESKSSSSKKQQQMAMNPEKIFSAVGLSSLQTLAFSLRDVSDGCLFNLTVNVPEASRSGLVKALTFPAKEAAPPPFVPNDAVKFTRWRLDLQKAFETIERTLKEAVPPLAGAISFMLDSPGKENPDLDLRKSLFGNLGDDIISYHKAPRGQTLTDLNSPPSLTLVSSPRPEQLAGAIKTLTSLLPQQPSRIKERDFLGRKIYALSLPATPPPGGGKATERTLNFTGSGGYLAISTDSAMLEEFLRSSEGAGKSLRDTPGLADAAQKIGGFNTGLFTYENQAETMRAAFETLKKESGTLASLLGSSPFAARFGMGEDSNKLKEWIDFSLLPSYDRISKYFYFNVWSGSVNSDGISFKMFAPNPPGLKK